MKRILTASLCTTLLASSLLAGSSSAAEVNVKKYTVGVNSSLFAQPHESVSDIYPYGFVGGFGSALAFKSYNKKTGEYEFYALTDRGPNGDSPNYLENGVTSPTKFFHAPSFTPQIGILKVKGNSAQINESILLKNKDNSKVTGLPLAPGQTGSTLEVPLLANMDKLSFDPNGLDPEGIAVDKEGNFWISDEYGPFIAKFSKTGKLLAKFQPGNGLPDILKHRIPNRGMEGLSISPSGKIYSVVQSSLEIDGKSNKALFTRIVMLDPKTKKTKMFAFPIETDKYKKSKDVKIGEVYAVNDSQLLVIEQGKDKNGVMRNIIKLVDIAKATDLTDRKTADGKELELLSDKTELDKLNITMATATEIVNLRDLGWDMEKAEGLTLLPDRKTLAIVNDNDFGVATSSTTGEDITSYTYNAATKKWALGNVETTVEPIFMANAKAERINALWFVHIPELTKLLKK